MPPMLAQTLREARRKKGWRVPYLSKRSGVSLEVIEQIEDEGSYYVPSEGDTMLLEQALGMPVGSLLVERDRLVERLPHRA